VKVNKLAEDKPKAAGSRMGRSAPSATAAPSKRQKWILASAGKGGTGKTSTSLNLAVCAVHAGLKVVLVDLDGQQSLSRWHQRRPEDAPEILLWQGKMSDASRAIDEVSALKNVDLVIVDTPPGIDDSPQESRLLVNRADLVLVPTTSGTADLDSVIEWMGFLRRERVSAAFLLNKVQRSHRRYQAARTRLNAAGPLCPVDVRLLDDIEATHDLGVGAIEIRRSKAIEDIRAVWLFVCHQLLLEPAA
jgi:chromosome partitioning protein